MAADVQPLAQVKLQVKPSAASPEQLYWQTFKSPIKYISPTKHAINHISQPIRQSSVAPNTSDYFVVSTGARLQLYSVRTRKLVKTITRFDDVAFSGELRHDGRVLVAGDNTGTIQAFDINSRAILKTWKEQKQPVHVTKWHPRETTSLMSCGDDATVRLWDLPTDNAIVTFRGHQDYVRSGCFLPSPSSSNNIMVSGSYDSTIRLWDVRVPQNAVMVFEHSSSVESILALSSGTTLLASAQNEVVVFDIVAGKALHTIRNHQKTVTAMCLAQNSSRLVTGALDGHLKIFDTTSWNYVAGSKYSNAILSLSVLTAPMPGSAGSREDKHIAVGMSDGTLSIKTRLSGEQKVREREKQKEMTALLAGTLEEHDRKKSKLAKIRGKGWEKRLRGHDFDGEGADIIVEGGDQNRGSRKKLSSWDKALHSNRYSEALDLAIESKQLTVTHAVLIELRYRAAMRAALENRNENTLQPILHWIYRNIVATNYSEICVEAAMHLFDLYAQHVWASQTISDLVIRLHHRVDEELKKSQQAIAAKGMLELMVPGVSGVG